MLLVLLAGSAWAESSVSMKISGPGAVNDSTIKAGETVFIDIYTANDKERLGVSFGFTLKSEDIKQIVHVADSAGGINESGNVKGYNLWDGKGIFDVTGVMAPEIDWNGELPDLIGFAGAVAKQRYNPHEEHQVLGIGIMVPTAGTLVIDSAFFPPGGYWKWISADSKEGEMPKWNGPYSFTVVK
jgi:hypothetical protein